MEWDMLQIKLANKANLNMGQTKALFHEVTSQEQSMVQFSFAKYQFCKMQKLYNDYNNRVNTFSVASDLW